MNSEGKERFRFMVFNATFNNIPVLSWVGGKNVRDRRVQYAITIKKKKKKSILVCNKQVHNIISDADY